MASMVMLNLGSTGSIMICMFCLARQIQGKNITWNIPVQWTGALKNYLSRYKSYIPKLFDFLAYCRCEWLVKFLIPKDKKVHARRACTAKIYMPTVKINLPRAIRAVLCSCPEIEARLQYWYSVSTIRDISGLIHCLLLSVRNLVHISAQ